MASTNPELAGLANIVMSTHTWDSPSEHKRAHVEMKRQINRQFYGGMPTKAKRYDTVADRKAATCASALIGSSPQRPEAQAHGCTCAWYGQGSIADFAYDCPIRHLHRGAPSMNHDYEVPGCAACRPATPKQLREQANKIEAQRKIQKKADKAERKARRESERRREVAKAALEDIATNGPYSSDRIAAAVELLAL